MTNDQLIIITGPTAVGKTKLAVQLADRLGGEIISADSRQVYRKMDIGTGKDLEEYTVAGKTIPYHLIDIRDPGYRYSIKEFYPDFLTAYKSVISKNRVPILCGGSGLYLETALRGNPYAMVPENQALREVLMLESDQSLYQRLEMTGPDIRAFADFSARKKIIRALEIAEFLKTTTLPERETITLKPIIFVLEMDRELVKTRIKERLMARLEGGLIEEVQNLISSGVDLKALADYGLEYKWVTEFILGNMSYSEMVDRLNISIRQFAKRQMTWFRRMEKQGYELNWINAEQNIEAQLKQVLVKIPQD